VTAVYLANQTSQHKKDDGASRFWFGLPHLCVERLLLSIFAIAAAQWTASTQLVISGLDACFLPWLVLQVVFCFLASCPCLVCACLVAARLLAKCSLCNCCGPLTKLPGRQITFPFTGPPF